MARRDVAAVALVDVSEAVDDVADEAQRRGRPRLRDPLPGRHHRRDVPRSVFDAISRKYGPVSLCVPAAGITRDDLAVRVDKVTGKARIYPLEQFRLVVDVNLIAPVYWALEMIGRIAEDRAARGLKRWTPDEGMQGSVVFIGSISSQGNRGQISYASTKAGLEGAAATIMKEAMYYGVRCSVIHPGFTDTPMVRAMGARLRRQEHPAVHAARPADPARRDRRRDLLHARQLGRQRRALGRRRLARAGLRAAARPLPAWDTAALAAADGAAMTKTMATKRSGPHRPRTSIASSAPRWRR